MLSDELDKILIVGRPNVGKSTLFNRLLGKRRSITHQSYGVTRDLLRELCKIDEREFILIDSAGFTLEKGFIEEKVVDLVLNTIEESNLILLTLDVNEITGEDETIIERMRKYTDKVVLVVNKVDSKKQESLAFNFEKLGFKDIFFVSAEHNLGIYELKQFLKNSLSIESIKSKLEDEDLVKIALIGKPNAGKSSLVNFLSKSEASLVSSLPGTTRDFIKAKFKHNNKLFEIVDTAGIRRKSNVDNVIEYYSINRAIKILDEVEIVFLLIDVNEDLSNQDKKIAYQAAKRGKAIIIVFSKWDLAKNIPNYFTAIKDRFKYMFAQLSYAPILKVSTKTGEGIKELLDISLKLREELYLKTSTSNLNSILNIWRDDYNLSLNNYKIKYITQVSVNPVKFIVFVNKVRGFPLNYLQYITNNIRKIGYSHIPLILQLRQT